MTDEALMFQHKSIEVLRNTMILVGEDNILLFINYISGYIIMNSPFSHTGIIIPGPGG